MANTYKHKLTAKFKLKMLPFDKHFLDVSYSELSDFYPIKLIKKFDRKNYKLGYFRHLRNKQRIKILNNEFYTENIQS